VVSADKKALPKTRSVICEALNPEQIKRVRFLTPEELFTFVEGLEVNEAGKGSGGDGDGPELLTAKEVAAMLRIDRKTIYSYVEKGLLPYVRMQSNLRFLKSEIEKWIAEHQFRPKGPKKG
jgi:excisionase family DNA binding protein